MRLFVACLAPLWLSLSPGVLPASTAGDADSAALPGVTNPIAWADIPDLSVIRVGDTYYMSSTTMHLSPGLPIMKSRDLVNWQLIGYAYDTLGDNDALTLRQGRNAYGAGSWASSLRYHNGTFYATTFSQTTSKTHVYRTKDPEKGPWAAASFRPALHDRTLFFDDDGRVYMIYGVGSLRLVELTVDVSAIKPGGVNQVIIPNASRVAGPNIGLPAEGSQLWKINGKYYLFNITWPRGGMRTVIIHRADRITGPYEGRLALQDKGVARASGDDQHRALKPQPCNLWPQGGRGVFALCIAAGRTEDRQHGVDLQQNPHSTLPLYLTPGNPESSACPGDQADSGTTISSRSGSGTRSERVGG